MGSEFIVEAAPAHLVDVASLEAYVNEHVPGRSGVLAVEKHTAGFSNETFYVSRGEERWVMRRPPAGPLLPTAHDVLREYRFIAGLYGRARVPRPVLLCEDTSVIGAPFYLMERTGGHVPRFELPPHYDHPEGRRRMGEEMIDALVELHAVDWRAAGLSGRDGGYITRQVERWASQWQLTRPRTRELPGLDAITTWMRGHIPPEQPHTVVHGDYKFDNVMYSHAEPRLVAIFDWEMATIGDPLADLGYLANTWTNAERPPGFEERPLIRTGLTELEGFPTADEMVARYESRSGRSMRDMLFYRALAAWKGIVIIEGLYMLYLEGSAANPAAADFEWRVPIQTAILERMIDRGE